MSLSRGYRDALTPNMRCKGSKPEPKFVKKGVQESIPTLLSYDIFKLLSSPEIDSKESTSSRFLASIDCSKISALRLAESVPGLLKSLKIQALLF
jgi:hypothetical protein